MMLEELVIIAMTALVVFFSACCVALQLLGRVAAALDRISDMLENTAPGGVLDVKVR